MHIRSHLHHRRLQISLIDTRRVDGKVRQEHVASLGSISHDMAVQDRVAFWTQVHPRLSIARRNVETSTWLRDMFQATVDSKKAMLAKLQRDIAEGETQVAKMDDAVKHGQDKLNRLKAGEDVSMGKELDYAAIRAILKKAGWTRSKCDR
jgi:hypothetical protein